MAQHLSWHPSMVRAKGSHQTVPVPSRRQQHATGALQSDHTGTMAAMDKRNYKLPSGIPPVIKHCIFGNSELPKDVSIHAGL